MLNEKPLILLLHPDDCYRTVLAFVLRQHQMEVREAATPSNCGEVCRGSRPALILLDWHFCGEDPGSFLNTLRKEPVLHAVPAMLIGPPPSRDHIKTAGKQGVAAIMIPQGFTIEAFIAKVRLAMHQAPAPDSENSGSEARAAASLLPQTARITSSEIESQLRRMPPVPVLESTVNELIHASSSQSGSAGELAEIVLRDPGATLHLLSKVNAADMRGEREPTCRVGEAIHLLGVREFYKFIQSMPLLSEKSTQNTWASQSWRGGILAGSRIAGLLAQRLGWSEPREMQAVALLHDLGHPLLAAMYPAAAEQFSGQAIPEGVRAVDVERRMMGTDHATIGGILLQARRLPPWAVECVTYHHVAEALRPALTRQAKLGITILQAVDQILAALVGFPGMHDVLEGFSEETLKAMEDARLDTERFTDECKMALEEISRELAFLRPDATVESIPAPALPAAAYVNPKRMPMDAMKLFAAQNVAELREISVSQIEQSAAQMPLIINFSAVRGDAALASLLEHLPRDGGRGAIFFGESARTAVIQQLETAGWLCTRLPAPVGHLRRLIQMLAAPVSLGA